MVVTNSNKCDFCKGKLIKTEEILTKGNKCVRIIVDKCLNCGEVFTTQQEVNKAMIRLNPSFIERLKEVFYPTSDRDSIHSLFKGKVL